MKDFIQPIIIAVLGILLIYALLNKPDPDVQIVTRTEVNTVTTIDTVFVRDTLFVNLPIFDPTPDIIDEVEVNKYTTTVSDSLIEGTVTSWVEGTLHQQTFEYTPKFPQYITRTDSVFVDTVTEITRTHYPSGIFVGGEVAIVAEQFDISPRIQYVRRDFSIGYRYGINTNSHHLSLMIRL